MKGRRSRLRVAIIAGSLVLAVLATATAALAIAEHDRIPAGTWINGVDVGRKTPKQAEDAIEKASARRLREPVLLDVASGPTSVTGLQLGAKARTGAAIEDAADAGVVARVKARLGFGENRRVVLLYDLNRSGVSALADVLDARVSTPARDASVTIRANGTTEVVPAVSGDRVNRAALTTRLRRLPATLVVPIRMITPRVSTADAERARVVTEALLSQSRQVALATTAVTLTPTFLQKALRFEPADGELLVTLDPDLLGKRLRPKFRALETPARDAGFTITASGGVVVRPAVDGRELAIERISASIVGNVGSTVHRARFAIVKPTFTTEAALKLRITERVSEFMTAYPCCAPRVTNIKRAAELLDGTILRPGEQFSLNEALGKRTTENGFLSAPQIRAGRLEDSIGGGISQIATTLFNAAFFAGLRLDEHQPHEFYISRYPMGREATISWGGPELIFTNTWPAGLLMKLHADDDSITVRFYSSSLGRRVKTVTEEPYAFRAPRSHVRLDKSLPRGTRNVEQKSGSSGFTVQFTREVFRGDKRIRNERYTQRYKAQDEYVTVGPPKKAKKQAPKPGDKPDQSPAEPVDPAPAAPDGSVTPPP